MAVTLSEEVLLDWQRQVDEVQALEAIFGDDFRILECSGIGGGTSDDAAQCSGRGGASGERQQEPANAASLALVEAPSCASWALDCSLMVQMAPPGGSLRLQLQEASSSSGGGLDGGGGGGGPAEAGGAPSSSRRSGGGGYQLQYLPPICMQLRLAAGYPGQQAPEVCLSALWLSSRQVASLEQQLLALWHEQGPGGPVCYTWADWLQSSALQHLGAAEGLVLADEPIASSSSNGSSSGLQAATGAAGDEAEGLAEDKLVKLLRWAGGTLCASWLRLVLLPECCLGAHPVHAILPTASVTL
jgi:E3 ubiquitin-protein ligase RNF14